MSDNAINLRRIADSLEKIAGTKAEPRPGEPNASGLAMLMGVCTGFGNSLKEILDDPNLDILKRATALRQVQKRAYKMAEEFMTKLEQAEKEAKGGQ